MKRKEKKRIQYPVLALHKKGIFFFFLGVCVAFLGLLGRLADLMLYQAQEYRQLAWELHTRERRIKAKRGEIIDRNGKVLASNKAVCTISVIHNQLENASETAKILAKKLSLDKETVQKKLEKVTAREIIKTNVEKEIGDTIRELDLPGVKVDEDYKRFYPFGSLASKVIGFTGADNQGILGLEVFYEDILKGTDGRILTVTDAAGIEAESATEVRIESIAGNTIKISLDWNVQSYVEQVCMQLMEEKEAKQVSAIVMNPQNGEIYAMVNVPEFDLNDPFSLPEGVTWESEKEHQMLLNAMWRNANISDTYEPGSTFKIITAAAALEEKLVSLEENFSCPGFYVVENRRIRCHKTTGHGAETFLQAIENSCNPVFIQLGLRLGAECFCEYFKKLQILEKTGIDLVGEAKTIMHAAENMGEVETATVSFGQSFQVTAIRHAATISSIINGGYAITPHFGMEILNEKQTQVQVIPYETKEQVLSEDVSKTMRFCLEKVVSEGGGSRAQTEGYQIGGKTATSEKLPRGTGKYISSFVGFAPADDPKVLALFLIDEPVGTYYGGLIAAPAVKTIFETILPYLLPEQSPLAEEISE